MILRYPILYSPTSGTRSGKTSSLVASLSRSRSSGTINVSIYLDKIASKSPKAISFCKTSGLIPTPSVR